jgi:hypothetical protein
VQPHCWRVAIWWRTSGLVYQKMPGTQTSVFGGIVRVHREMEWRGGIKMGTGGIKGDGKNQRGRSEMLFVASPDSGETGRTETGTRLVLRLPERDEAITLRTGFRPRFRRCAAPEAPEARSRVGWCDRRGKPVSGGETRPGRPGDQSPGASIDPVGKPGQARADSLAGSKPLDARSPYRKVVKAPGREAAPGLTNPPMW